MSVLPGPAAITAPTEQMRELTADEKDARRLSVPDGKHPGVRERAWGFESRLNRDVTFEEFVYWAQVERELEMIDYKQYQNSRAHKGFIGGLKGYFTSNPYEDAKVQDNAIAAANEKHDGTVLSSGSGNDGIEPIPPSSSTDLDAEWRRASRALRTAGWGAIFYLITTDILGWAQTPYVFSNTGFGLGVGIFVLMGLAAGASGIMIWRTFLALDSSRFPMVTFGDAFFRLFGPKTRHFINVLQSLQMFLSVSVVLLGQTQIIAQLGAAANFCFVAAGIISLVVSMASGYMRSLKHLGWFCNASVWINVVTFIIVIAAAATKAPDPVAAASNGNLNSAWAIHPAPVKTFIGTPTPEYQPTSSNLFAARFNGINSMVYAYSGAILFVAFLSEMRHPMDFWKAMVCAQLFISIVYIVFGAVVYNFYGQYAYSAVNQVVEPLSLQVVGNALSLVTGWLAVFLYFNVGMKTVYVEVAQEILKLPPITTKRGKHLWWALGPLYWIIAFIVAMSVPQFQAFTNFVGGLFSLNFTYSFSGIMYVAYRIQDGATLPGEGFDPETGVTVRHDNGMKRWIRGYFKAWYVTIPVTIFSLCGLASSGMGSWAGTLGLEAAFANGRAPTSWTCKNPFYTG